MLTNMKISTRLFTGFAIVLLFMIATGITSVIGMRTMMSQLHNVTEIHGNLMQNGIRARANINRMRRYEKDLFMNIGDAGKVDDYKKKWDDALERANKLIDASNKLLMDPGYPESDRVKDKETLANIKKQVDTYAAGFNKIYSKIKGGEITSTQDANKAIGEFKDATRQSEALVIEFSQKMDKGMEAEYKDATNNGKKVIITVSGIILVVLLFTAVLAYLIVKSIITPLARLVSAIKTIAAGDLTTTVEVTSKDEIGQLMADTKTMAENLRSTIGKVAATADQVASAASQLNSTAGRIATGSEEVAAQTTTVATASEEMSATSGDIAQNCQMAVEGAHSASEAAVTGSGVVSSTIAAMEQISQQVKNSATTVASLGSRSDQIGAIVGTIEDIADQTNLLALNAAIEAARAGEMGRGFAVVADEVRALAERTTKATREIGEMIKTIQSETGQAVKTMEQGVRDVEQGTENASQSGHALQEILSRINDVTMQINQIATAAEEQTATTSEITNNIHQISSVVQDTASGAHESATAAAQLHNNAEELQRLVRQFKL